MKTKTFIIALTFAFAAAAIPAFAQHGLGIGGAVASHTGISTSSSAATTAGAQAGSNAGVNAGAGTKAGTSAQAGTSVQSNTSTTSRTGATQTGAAAHAGESANIVTRIDNSPELASRVGAMLPSSTSISSAATGFKNEGQFVAAVEASHNLGISFSDLKAKMTGSTDMSLGAAIHASRPGMTEHEANEAAKKAEREAKKAIADAKADAKAARHVDTDAQASASGSATTAAH